MLDARKLIDNYLPLLKQNWLPLALGIVGLIFFIYGLIAFAGVGSNKGNLVLESSNSASESAKQVSKIAVDVEGAVALHGMYTLNMGSRVQDALIAAGGLSALADRNWVEKNLNLASILSDGSKIYIPRVGEAINPSTGATNNVQQNSISGRPGSINVNTATSAELDTLPGVGPATAQKIIDNRPYNSVDELLSKKSVNSKVFSDIKDKVSIN
jgi:competence protein ComEA